MQGLHWWQENAHRTKARENNGIVLLLIRTSSALDDLPYPGIGGVALDSRKETKGVMTMRCLEVTKNFLCGQVVSLFSLTALLMAKRLVWRGVSTPMLLNLFFYLFLAMTYVLYGWRQNRPTLPGQAQIRQWVYPLLALLDVQANICAVKSLEYVSFSTTGLMLNLAIPFVFVLCASMFRTPFNWKHTLGCGLTAIGAVVVLVGCFKRQQDMHASYEVFGWLLAVLAASLYAASNVVNQWCLKARGLDSIIDCLGMIGTWGAVFCLIQVILIERAEVAAIHWNAQIYLLFFGYVLCMFAFYTAVFVLVSSSETMVYNMSLLLSSVYLLLISHYLLGEQLDMFTAVATALMIVGLTIYSWHRTATGDNQLPQISFKSLQTPREEDLVLFKMAQGVV